jgi:hypothetical protein
VRAGAAVRTVLAAVALAASAPTVAQPAVLGASSAPDSVVVGEPFLAGVLVHAPGAANVQLILDAPDDAPYAITVPSRMTAADSEGRHRVVATLVVWVVDPPPAAPARVAVTAPDGTVRMLPVALPLPPVQATLPGDSLLPRGPRGIVPASGAGPSTPWTALVGLGLLVLAVALLASRMRRRRGLPDIDRRRVALAALARLREEGLPERGRVDEHYARLSRIVREFAAPDVGEHLTTAEAVERLRTDGTESGSVDRLAALLADADRVKFARSVPSPEHARSDLDAAHGWIREFDVATPGRTA